MKNIIELKKVTKKFGGITALNKASLHVNLGEVVGLIGDNGAGKSTLIKTLVGVYNPDEGEIKIRNNKIINWTAWGIIWQCSLGRNRRSSDCSKR